MTTIRSHIQDFRKSLEEIRRKKQSLRTFRKEPDENHSSPLDSFQVSQDTSLVLNQLLALTLEDMQRYTTPPPLFENDTTEDKQTSSHTPIQTQRKFVAHMRETLLPLCLPKKAPPIEEKPSLSPPAALTQAEENLKTIFENTLAYLANPHVMQEQGGNLHKVQKIQRILKAIVHKNDAEAITILKSAIKDDPHDHTLAYLASQYFYFQALNGQNKFLPDAREEVHKSALYSEKFDQDHLLFYRYEGVIAERNFSPERALEMMRENSLLGVDNLVGPEGLATHKGIHFKSWLILSTIPVEFWTDFEFSSLTELADKAVGGALIYLMFFRKIVLKGVKERKFLTPQIDELEERLARSYEHYLEITIPLQKTWPNKKTPLPWTVPNRYFNAFTTAAPIPTFDEVLAHTSLNGRNFQTNMYPERELEALIADTTPYWRLWAMAITPFEADRVKSALPTKEQSIDTTALPDANKMLLLLQDCEKERIGNHVQDWNELTPYMMKWSIDHLLAAGTGSSKPRLKFQPTLIPFNNLYRLWSTPSPQSPLFSEIIATNAKQGAFASIHEILSVFEGAYRLLDDRHHGLKGQLTRAKKEKRTEKNKRNSIGNGDITFSMIAPLGVLAFVGVSFMAADMLSHKIMLGLVGLLSLGWLVYSFTRK